MMPAVFSKAFAGVIGEAWALAHRDHALLVAIAGIFLFMPQFAALLFWIDPPVFPGFAAQPDVSAAYVKASQAWFASNGLSLLLAAVLALAGQVAILLLYVDRRRLTVAGALSATPALFFPALLVSLIATPLAIALGYLIVLIVLGAYLQGRLMLALPVLLGERPVSVVDAVRASWRRTRGHGVVMSALACVAVLGGPLFAAPLRAIGASFDGAPLANPVAAAMLDAGTALVLTAGAVFGLLIQVAAYRRLSSGT